MTESSVTQKALLAMQKLQARVNALESSQREPIAIVGAGCRLPGGVRNPDDFWDFLKNGRDAIRPVPPSRWSTEKYFDPVLGAPGKTVSRMGGYLEEVYEFDAGFFGISRREACEMDPQQRLLVETSWEAIENACIAASSLSNSRTGVLVGVAAGDYANLRIATETQAQIDSYTASSTSASVAAGRIAYILGLHGPCLSIDTACSSSLTAIYLAVQSLRLRECDAALAGGVNLALSPYSTAALSQMRMLSPSDRCRPFDASADGFVRGEGCVMLMLRRLADALSSGDPILAVIRGAAINHDGRSGGLTAPNGPAQEAVMHRALSDANCTPADVDWVEAHGTGTQLGDPIEAQALSNVYGAGHTAANPLWISALKSNIGHLESGAGAAALLKAVLALRHGSVPPSLHFREPNPLIRWDQIPIRVASQLTSIPHGGRLRRAGVSSFGFSGTNVHLILEEPPAPAQTTDTLNKFVLPVSAKSEIALRKMVAQWADFLDCSPVSFPSVCRTANSGRNRFNSRVFFAGGSVHEVVSSMRLWLTSPRAALNGTGLPQFESCDPQPGAPRSPLPTYPFSRHRHWFTEDGAIEFRIDPSRMPLLADHQIGDSIAVPAAVLIDLAFQAAERWRGAAPSALRHLAFANLLSLKPEEVRIIQVFFRREGEHGASWECSSVLIDRTELHAAGQVFWHEHLNLTSPPCFDPSVHISREGFYRERLGRDLHGTVGVLGPAFQWICRIEINHSGLSADIDAKCDAWSRVTPALTPALLAIDAVFQLVVGAAADHPRPPGLFLPFLIEEIWPVQCEGTPERVVMRKEEGPDDPNNISLREAFLLDARGDALVSVRGITLRRFDQRRTTSELLYRPTWRNAEAVSSTSRLPSLIWLFGDSDAIAELEESWRDGVMEFHRQSIGEEDALRLTRDSHLIFLGPKQGDEDPDRCFALVTFLKHLNQLGVTCNVWVVTTGTNAIEADYADKTGAMLWAVTRVARLEHPELHPRLVDLDPKDPNRFDALRLEIENVGGGTIEVAWRNGRRLKPSLASMTSACETFRAKPDVTYWITGGFGALGQQTAVWLASRGARYLALSGRRRATPQARITVEQLERSGVRVLQVTGDIADRSSALYQLEEIKRKMPPLAGIFHAAGILEDLLIARSDQAQFQRVLVPKVQGAMNIASLLGGRQLDFLVFFSSISVWTAPPGQVAYAAANAFLDAFAETRNASGRRTLSLNWGPWQGVGMAAASDATGRLAASAGIQMMPPERALSALGVALSGNESRLVIAGIDRRAARNHPGLAALLDLQVPQQSLPAACHVKDTIPVRIAKILQIAPDSLELDRPLTELGVDSLVALELKQSVEKDLPRKLPLNDYLSGISVREIIARLGTPETSAHIGNELFFDLAPPPQYLFLFPGAVGSANYLYRLARGLDRGYRPVGVQSLLKTSALESVQALATYCFSAIRSRQPRGPYFLAGHSFGGFIALEIARQIRDLGERVGFLGLIDTAVLTRSANIGEQAGEADFRYVARVLHCLYCDLPSFPITNDLSASEELMKVVQNLEQQGAIPPGFRPTEMVDRARAAFRAMMSYQIRVYTDPVSLFRAKEPLPVEYFGEGSRGAAWDDPDLGWRSFLPQLKTISVPGNHLTVVQDPNATELGRAIAGVLPD